VVEQVKNQGFNAASPEFIYRYTTAGDDRVCSECLGYDGTLFTGDQVPSKFPQAEYVGSNMWVVNLHDLCRCTLDLDNGVAACTQKLYEELNKQQEN